MKIWKRICGCVYGFGLVNYDLSDNRGDQTVPDYYYGIKHPARPKKRKAARFSAILPAAGENLKINRFG